MNLLWLIEYLCIALDCDSPVLEAFWISGDRMHAEQQRILPRLQQYLVAWGFVIDASVLPPIYWRRIFNASGTSLSEYWRVQKIYNPRGIHISHNGVERSFYFNTDEPVTRFSMSGLKPSRATHQSLNYMTMSQTFSRMVWWDLLLNVLKPEEQCIP